MYKNYLFIPISARGIRPSQDLDSNKVFKALMDACIGFETNQQKFSSLKMKPGRIIRLKMDESRSYVYLGEISSFKNTSIIQYIQLMGRFCQRFPHLDFTEDDFVMKIVNQYNFKQASFDNTIL